MALSIGDVIKITDVQEFLAQRMLNVYFYRLELDDDADEDKYFEIAAAFANDVCYPISQAQSASARHTEIRVENVTNELDFLNYPLNLLGSYTGDASPTFLAYKFVLRRGTKLTRNGYKRIGGVPEGLLVGNSITAGGITLMDAIAPAMANDLIVEGSEAGGMVLTPVIVGRNVDGSLDLTRVQPVASVTYDIRITSQVSRKVRLA